MTLAAALAALEATLRTAAAPARLLRNADAPARLDAEGLVLMRDGQTQNEVPIMSPYAHMVEHGAEIEIHGPTVAIRDTLAAALLAAVAADRQLGGAVEWCELRSASYDAATATGAIAAQGQSLTALMSLTVPA